MEGFYGAFTNKASRGLLWGGQYEKIHRQLDSFFSRLVNAGAKLVFFSNGYLQDKELKEWMEQQEKDYKLYIEILKSVDKGDHLNVSDYRHLPNRTFHVGEMARKYGIFRTSIENEYNQDIAAYATSRNAMAIVSNYIDFLIFDGCWRVWKSKKLNLKKFTAFEYSREALMEFFGLSRPQMHLLATLSGNAIIDHTEVQPFHHKLGNPSHKYRNLANYIRERSNTPVNTLVNLVFDSTCSELNRRFQRSLDFYNTVSN